MASGDRHRSFGDLLRRLRAAAGLTQEELAERAFLSVRAISDLERGLKHRPRRDTVQLLADALELDGDARESFEAAARAPPAAMASHPSPDSLPTPPHLAQGAPDTRLPVHATTPLIGRERELSAITSLLDTGATRLVTLRGPGGAGKTRLALHAGQNLAPLAADGVYWVDLAPISDTQLLLPAVARALGITAGRRPLLEAVSQEIGSKRLLLLLDNFEQVMDAAPVVGELIATCPSLWVIVTSRAALRLSGERVVSVSPLPLPDPQAQGTQPSDPESLMRYAAIQLFVERAQAADPGFRLTVENADAVVEICRRLDGLPLAIELAAARARVLPPRAMLSRLEPRLSRVLGSGSRDMPARQQTLRRTIDWSYDLLEESARRAFRGMAIFPGGCTLPAAAAVLDPGSARDIDVLDDLEALVDHSLALVREEPDGEPRFLMLDAIREYALERLEESGDLESVRQRLALYFVNLARDRAAPHLEGPDQATWLARLDADHDNLFAALEACGTESRVEAGITAAAGLWRFWLLRGYVGEARRLTDNLLGAARNVSIEARALAYGLLARLTYHGADYSAAETYAREALTLQRDRGDPDGIAASLHTLSGILLDQGQYDDALPLEQEALDIRRTLDDASGIRVSLNGLGIIETARGHFDRASHLLREAVQVARDLHDTTALATTLANLGEAEYGAGRHAEALPLYEESLALFEKTGFTVGMAGVLHSLGLIRAHRGEYDEALRLCLRALALSLPADHWSLANALEDLAIVMAQRDPENAAPIFGMTDRLRDEIGAPQPESRRADRKTAVDNLERSLGSSEYTAQYTRGNEMTPNQILEAAQALVITPLPPPRGRLPRVERSEGTGYPPQRVWGA